MKVIKTTVAKAEMALFNNTKHITDGDRISVKTLNDRLVAQYPDRGPQAVVNVQLYDEQFEQYFN